MSNVYNNMFSKLDVEKCWRKTRKIQYTIKARFSIGENIFNKIEGSRYVTNDAQCIVLKGTIGEEWVTTADSLQKTYVLKSGSVISDRVIKDMKGKSRLGGWVEIMPSKKSYNTFTNYALFLNIKKYRNISIATSYGTVLVANRDGIPHGKGDFLVCGVLPNGKPDFNDMWVVNGKVFVNTYSTVSFGGDSLRYVI